MAYLGYQVSSPALVEYGLTLAQARVPGDPLLALLRTAWLKQYIEEAPSATQPARE
jgi:hypothetical protein